MPLLGHALVHWSGFGTGNLYSFYFKTTKLFKFYLNIQIKNSMPSNAPRLNILLDIIRLEWSPPFAQFILRAHNSLQQ